LIAAYSEITNNEARHFSQNIAFINTFAMQLVELASIKGIELKTSGIARRGKWGHALGAGLGAQALGAHQHVLCSHLKTHFKQKFRPNYA